MASRRRWGWWVACVLGAVCDLSAGPVHVWWEAEDAAGESFPAASAFAAGRGVPPEALSGGDWLSSSGPSPEDSPSAVYELEVPEAGEYRLWVRKFYKHGPMHWRFGSGAWQTLTRAAALTDRNRLPRGVELSWVSMGRVELGAGRVRFEVKLAVQPGEDSVSGLDCFVLSREPFFPRGTLRPGEPAPWVEEPGWFVFDPPIDGFSPDAALDLRHLNESEAGEHGPLRRSEAGDELRLGDGTPVRFWGVNVSHNQAGHPDELVVFMARRLAKLGVNMVRFHGPIWADDDTSKLDPRRLDRLHHLVASLKAQGIYTNLSWYFPVWIRDAGDLGLAGYDAKPAGKRKPFGVLFFNEKAQRHYFDTLRELMTTPNPYTGLSLAKDPAVGIVELCNEDNLFFWTFNRKTVPSAQWDLLEARFGAHLAEKYSSVEAALRRWPGAKHARDDAGAGRAGVSEAAAMTGEAVDKMNRDERARAGEQVAFLAGLQRGFYARAAAYLRDELGFAGLVSAGNWYPADPALMDAVERWTYTVGDVIDRHGYFNPKHEGEGATYSVRVGHRFEDRPAVREPGRPPVLTNQVAGYPQIISELGWSNPNRYRADATLLTAAALSTQGLDGVFFFSWNMHSGIDTVTNKFPVSVPVVAGSFPAMALMARRGDLPVGPVVVHEALRTAELFGLEGSAAVTEAAYDAFRAADVPAGAAMEGRVERFDPFTAWTGRVTRSFDTAAGPGSEDLQVNLSGAIDRPGKKIARIDGGLTWDYGVGVAVIDTPNCVAAAGFLKEAGAIERGPVEVDSANVYGQVAVIALDGRPLTQSKRILIQAVTQEKLEGFAADRDGRITDLGRPPWKLREVRATVTLRLEGGPARRVVALDGNGEAVPGSVERSAEDGTLVITLPRDRLYTLVER
ncbi:MAG: hypothetical protein AAGG38_05015 [Planctomycetota bacterium]